MNVYTINGKDLLSVTTIIHELGNDALMTWANVMGFKKKSIKQLQEESSSYGTLVHMFIRSIIDPSKNVQIPPVNDYMTYRLDIIKKLFLDYMNQFKWSTLDTEKTIGSIELGYAGTMDWVLELDGKRTLIDFKTSKSVYPTMFLQLGGYMNLLDIIGEPVEQAGILLVRETGCSLVMIPTNMIAVYKESFNVLADFVNRWVPLKRGFQNR